MTTTFTFPTPRLLATWLVAAVSFATLARPAAAQDEQQQTITALRNGDGSDGCRTLVLDIVRCDGRGERTRAAVVAELRNAQAAGEFGAVGELSEAPIHVGAAGPAAPTLTRFQVKAELALARANHELPGWGEL